MDGKKFVTRSSREKSLEKTLSSASHLAKRKFTFIRSSSRSFPTNKNCYFIVKPYLYVFCCCCWYGMADFEQFIYFILRVHVFQELSFSPRAVSACCCFSPPVLFALRRFSRQLMCAIRRAGEGRRRNSTTIS